MKPYHICRGLIPDAGTGDAIVKIQLFDGSFETGYRIISFDIAPSDWSIDPDVTVKLTTEDPSTLGRAFEWDFGDNRQKGWATYQANGASATGNYYSEHLDDVIVEDLYIRAYSQTDQGINYKLVLEKVNISEYEGALALVRNSSQG